MSTNVAKFLAVATVVVAMLSASDTRAGELKTGIVIRGIGATKTCSAATVVPDGDRTNGRVSGLSVNCTDATTAKNDYYRYTRGLPQTKYCVGRITQIVRNKGTVTTAPTKENRLHCLIDKIKVNALVGEMTPKP